MGRKNHILLLTVSTTALALGGMTVVATPAWANSTAECNAVVTGVTVPLPTGGTECGVNSVATGINATAVSSDSTATGANTAAIGSNATASTVNRSWTGRSGNG